MENSCNFDEKQRLTDLLTSQKFITGVYNNDLIESATPEVTNCFRNILLDEHKIQHEIFEEMSSRGLYPVEKAPEEKLNQTLLKYKQKTLV